MDVFNQNSANLNSNSDKAPLAAYFTPVQDGNNNDQGTNKGQNTNENRPTGNDGTRTDTNENLGNMYNPEAALNATGIDGVPEGVNLYRNKKTLTQGLMDIALFSSNANQLRHLLDNDQGNEKFYIILGLIILSLVLQIGVGLLLLISTRYNLSVANQRDLVYRYGNYVVVGIFLITIINVFIAAFGTVGTVDSAVNSTTTGPSVHINLTHSCR